MMAAAFPNIEPLKDLPRKPASTYSSPSEPFDLETYWRIHHEDIANGNVSTLELKNVCEELKREQAIRRERECQIGQMLKPLLHPLSPTIIANVGGAREARENHKGLLKTLRDIIDELHKTFDTTIKDEKAWEAWSTFRHYVQVTFAQKGGAVLTVNKICDNLMEEINDAKQKTAIYRERGRRDRRAQKRAMRSLLRSRDFIKEDQLDEADADAQYRAKFRALVEMGVRDLRNTLTGTDRPMQHDDDPGVSEADIEHTHKERKKQQREDQEITDTDLPGLLELFRNALDAVRTAAQEAAAQMESRETRDRSNDGENDSNDLDAGEDGDGKRPRGARQDFFYRERIVQLKEQLLDSQQNEARLRADLSHFRERSNHLEGQRRHWEIARSHAPGELEVDQNSVEKLHRQNKALVETNQKLQEDNELLITEIVKLQEELRRCREHRSEDSSGHDHGLVNTLDGHIGELTDFVEEILKNGEIIRAKLKDCEEHRKQAGNCNQNDTLSNLIQQLRGFQPNA